MHSPTHYEILQVAPTASVEDIKKAFRKLALLHHPDVAGNSEANLEYFRKIKTAYDVLVNTASRQKYHHTLFSQAKTNNTPVPTPDSIITEAQSLADLVAKLDPHRLDYELLQFQIVQIIATVKQLTVRHPFSTIHQLKLVNALLQCIKLLPYKNAIDSYRWLLHFSHQPNNSSLIIMIETQSAKHKKSDFWNRYQFLFALLVAILFCVLMFVLG